MRFGLLTAFALFLLSCETRSNRQHNIEFDTTHHRLVFLYDTFVDLFHDLNNNNPELTLKSQEFLLRVEDGLEIKIKSLGDIKDGWGNSLQFQVDDKYDPITNSKLVEIVSAGKNGVFGDQDDMKYPDFGKYHSSSEELE